MNVQLKEILLEKAVHGELIPNDKNLKPIDVESILEDVPYEIPKNWRWAKLSSFCNKIVDGSHNPPLGKKEVTDYKMLSATNLLDKDLDTQSKVRYLSKEDYEICNKRIQLKQGDILLSIVGTIGKTLIYDLDSKISFQRSVAIIECKEKIWNRYIMYCLKTKYYKDYMNEKAKGTAQKGFYLKELKSLKFPLPPTEEQKRIVEKLEECFELIDQKERNDQEQRKLKQLLKETLLEKAIHGELIPNDKNLKPVNVESILDDVPFQIPENWRWTEFQSIFDVKGGKRIPSHKKLINKGKRVYIRVTDMENMTIKTTNLKYIEEETYESIKNYIITKEDLYVTVAGTIGRVGSIPKELDGMNLTENANRLIPKNVDKEYYKYILNGKYYQNILKENATKTAQPKLAIKRINKIKIVVPPIEEQKRIVKKLEECFELIDKL